MGRWGVMMRSALQGFSSGMFFKFLKKTLFLDDKYLIYKANTDSSSRPVVPSINGIRIEKGNLKELNKMIQELNLSAPEFHCHKLDGVEDFFIAKNETGIQHISWIYRHHHYNRLLSLGKNEVEIKYCLTMRSSRGKGIYPKVLGELMDYLEKQKILSVYMCVDPANFKSIRGMEKAGFRMVGSVRYRKIFGVFRSKPLIARKLH